MSVVIREKSNNNNNGNSDSSSSLRLLVTRLKSGQEGLLATTIR
jgi:hypothetical protein